jgi:hypothetical protein
MANSKISALTSATTPLAGTEVLPIVQSSTTKQVSVANLTAGRTQTSNGIVQGTAATGYNFTANTPASGMTSQLLNWYEQGTWTPVLTFQTPSDLAVAYTVQVGSYTRIGNRVILQGFLVLSSFTYTTTSGYLKITGIPFNATTATGHQNYGSLQFGGITKVGYTNFVTSIEPGLNNAIIIYCSGSGLTPDYVSASNMPSGSNVSLKFTMTYEV